MPRWLRGATLCILLPLLLIPLSRAGGYPASRPRHIPVLPPLPPRYDGGAPAPNVSPAWTVQRVDAPKRFEQMEDRSLALDAAGHPHLAYGGDFLYYAYHDGTAWRTETVDDSGGVGYSAALALDAAGRPHVAYYDATGAGIRYAYHDGTRWRIQAVDGGRVDGTLSLALDAAGHPHLTYAEALSSTEAHLKYAYLDGAGWHFQVIEGAGWLGWHSSLALDSQDRPHVTYYVANQDNYFNDLRYAYYDGTAWITTTVDTGAPGDITGWYNSLALDAQDRPHVSYYDYDRAALRYAYFDGAAWELETVDNTGDPGWYGTSLALDAQGHPRISYCPSGGWYNCAELRYAAYDGAAWSIQVVDDSAAVGQYSSLALDKAGDPHISYYDDTHSRLKYAAFDGAVWQLQDVDQAGDAGQYTSLAFDAAGRPHIAYCRYDPWMGLGGSCTALMHAYYDGAAWQVETVDSGGVTGAWIALAVDAAGYAHVSYTAGWPQGEVRYAWQDAGGWHVQVVAPVVAQDTSLALDANLSEGQARPRVTYHDWSDGHLKYALFDGSAWEVQTADGATDAGA
jgi:hypothetical protein